MATIIKLPSVVADATSAILQGWLVQSGDTVTVGDPIADIETEKATVELEAEASGTVGRLLVEAGTMVPVGDPIAVLTTAEDDEASIAAALARSGASAQPEPPGQPAQAAPAGGSESTPAPTRPVDRIPSSPLARRRARELGVDFTTLAGSGPGGRILRADVESAEPATAAAEPPSTGSRSEEGFERIPLTGMRAAIARRLTESKTTVPHFYLSVDVEMDALMTLRRQINHGLAETPGQDGPALPVTVNDLCLKALGLALRDVPEANVAWGGDHLRRFHSVDVSVAIATEGGLITPVVTALQDTTLMALSRIMRDFKVRAGAGRIEQRELEGGAFSLTNLGMFGTRDFSAILNPPQAGILALGTAEQRPVVRDGELAVATVMTATLSADHRVIDGAVAARLVEAFTRRIEHPLTLLL